MYSMNAQLLCYYAWICSRLLPAIYLPFPENLMHALDSYSPAMLISSSNSIFHLLNSFFKHFKSGIGGFPNCCILLVADLFN